MEKLIPIYYTEYGRYISRHRALPFQMDCLTPVYRRILLSMHEIASRKLVKCAKVVGHVIGSYHPHGDQSVYGSLINLYNQGFIEMQGNAGSVGLDDSPPAAYRYTECKLKHSWLESLYFAYNDYVTWDYYEFEKEPLFIVGPIPLGLIGDGDVYSGISFHTTLVPRYSLRDLSKRLKYLISQDEKDKVIIYPNFEKNGCICQEDDEQAENILKTGKGKLVVLPNGAIQGKEFHIYGRVPQTTFNDLRKDPNISCADVSDKNNKLDILIKPSKRVDDYNKFFEDIYYKYLVKPINFNVCVCDENGVASIKGIDELLIDCFNYYVQSFKFKMVDACYNEIEKKSENEIVLIIRKILNNNPNVKIVDDIIKIYQKNPQIIKTESYSPDQDIWVKVDKKVEIDDIRKVCSNKNIKTLIEYNLNILACDQKINEFKSIIFDSRKHCIGLINNLSQ